MYSSGVWTGGIPSHEYSPRPGKNLKNSHDTDIYFLKKLGNLIIQNDHTRIFHNQIVNRILLHYPLYENSTLIDYILKIRLAFVYNSNKADGQWNDINIVHQNQLN